MATPIPVFVSQFIPVSGTTFIADDAGNHEYLVDDLFGNIWQYLVSNRTTVANGMSLLKAIESGLNTSGGKTWTVRISATSPFKLTFAHNSGSSTGVSMSSDLESALGWDSGTTVGVGATVTAARASSLLWTPDMPISMTGPQMFDPLVSYGVPTSAGAVQRAPDMTAAAVSNGVQWSAEYRFNGVQPYYKLRASGSPYVNQDLETFWTNNLSKGRRVLMWRDRTNITGSSAPSEGSASPYNYVEYFPQPSLRENLPGTPMAPPNLVYWDVSLPFYVTENGETPLTD